MGRPKVAILSRDRIADAAIALIDKHGRFTVQDVARSLGVSPPSLYNHVKGHAEILELVRQRIHVEQGPKIDRRWRWQEVVRHVARHDRESIGRHPWVVADIMISTVSADEPLESVATFADVLSEAGFATDDVYRIIGSVDLLSAGGALDVNAPERVYPIDAELADDALGRSLRANPHGRERADLVFEFALDRLVESLEALLERTRSAAR